MNKQFTFTIDDLVGGEVYVFFGYGYVCGTLSKPGGTSDTYFVDGERVEFTEADIDNIEIEGSVVRIFLV